MPTRNFGSFITTTIYLPFPAFRLHSQQRAAQNNNQGTLYNRKQPHRQNERCKNPPYVCKGTNSARPTEFLFHLRGTPFQYYITKECLFLLLFYNLPLFNKFLECFCSIGRRCRRKHNCAPPHFFFNILIIIFFSSFPVYKYSFYWRTLKNF